MMRLDHGIVECHDFPIIARQQWNGSAKGWGFFVCRAPEGETLYGAVGALETERVQGAPLGVPLPPEHQPDAALALFGLACGLSVTRLGGLELGDQLVVTGINPLALAILRAARLQGARTAIVHHGDTRASSPPDGAADAIFNYADLDAEAVLRAFIAGGPGKTVLVDAVADSTLALALTEQVTKFGVLVFARADSQNAIVVNIRQVHHLQSAHFQYWSPPQTLATALALAAAVERAARLVKWQRVSVAGASAANQGGSS